MNLSIHSLWIPLKLHCDIPSKASSNGCQPDHNHDIVLPACVHDQNLITVGYFSWHQLSCGHYWKTLCCCLLKFSLWFKGEKLLSTQKRTGESSGAWICYLQSKYFHWESKPVLHFLAKLQPNALWDSWRNPWLMMCDFFY